MKKINIVYGAVVALTIMSSSAFANDQAKQWIESYENKLKDLYVAATRAEWKAANTGKTEDFDAKAKAQLELKTFFSDSERFKQLKVLLKDKKNLDPLTARVLSVAELDFKENALPNDLIKKMVEMSAKIEQTFNTYRADYEGKKLSNNDLLDLLEKEKDSAKRRAIWESLKQVGAAVNKDLVALAKVRNQAARKLGFKNFWDMRIRLQEHDPVRIVSLFSELEKTTNRPFTQMKRELDAELAKKFGVKASAIQAWHYDNPFFQAPPPSAAVDPDQFFKGKEKEDIVKIAKKYFSNIGLSISDIVDRSDLYERAGKDQHAFSTDIDRNGDVRTLQNVRPKADSMDTMLHEMGHGVYSKYIDKTLPFNLRDSAHIFTTEGIAMMSGALTYQPKWLIDYVDVEPKEALEAAEPMAAQRRREQLIFARWTLVMLNFEKALYEKPDQNLNQLWWTLVERFQKVPAPKGRVAPDWASKPHFTIAPVYYHNYMMGELFAAQLRAVTKGVEGKAFGEFLKKKVFEPGMRDPWPIFVKNATGEELTAKHFAAELK